MAMRSYLSSLLMIFAAVVLLLHQVDAADPWGRKNTSVVILNELPEVLAVHCFSRDDDLGMRYMNPWGTPYYFSFHSNFWGTTRFWCTFTRGRVTPGALWNSFPVWTDHGFFGGTKRPCDQCVWIARTDAFYRSEGGDVPIPAQPWRNDTQPA